MHSIREQVEYLSEFVTDYKNDLFTRLVNERTSYVTMVLEDLYQEHNCSAVLRSCDCFGIQNVHIIEDTYIDQLDLPAGKMAFFMGTELTGLSDEVLARADEFVKVPMYGFTESYNVSVCAALLMYSVVQRLRQTDIDWHLSEEERERVLFTWYKRSVKASKQILERFNQNQ